MVQNIEFIMQELKNAKNTILELEEQVRLLKFRVFDESSAKSTSEQQIRRLNKEIQFLKSEKQQLSRKTQNQIKNLEANLKRSNAFQSKMHLSSKNSKENVLLVEMDSLRKVNKTLLGFVDILSLKYKFDGEVIKTLCEIAKDTNDMIIQHFLTGLQTRNEQASDFITKIYVNEDKK